MAVKYQLVFTGQLLEGHDPKQVSQALGARLRQPAEQIHAWVRQGKRKVLQRSLEMETAKRFHKELAGLGLSTQIEAQSEKSVPAPTPSQPAQRPRATTDARPVHAAPSGYPWSWLQRMAPLRAQWLLAPGMVLGALFSVMLVTLHLGLILVALFGMILPSLTSSWAGNLLGNPLLGLPVQLFGALLGLGLLLLLVKPLLSVGVHRYRGQLLAEAHEPDLFAFVEDVCARSGAPMPALIFVEHTPRVEAHYYHGPLGFFRNQVVLTLGAPLVAGSHCGQLAAMIGQAMNRFRRQYVPHGNSVLLAIQHWLVAALNDPDPLDQRVQDWYRDGRIGDTTLRLYQRYVGVARWPVRVWLYLSQLLAHKWIHRLVADADKVALGFGGSEGMLRQMELLRLLEHSNRQLMAGLEKKWSQSRKLPEDLVRMMVMQARKAPSMLAQQLRQRQQQQFQARAEPIPSDHARLGRLLAQRVPGSYGCLSPATSLFRHFSGLSRGMTLRFYHHELHLPVSRHHLQRIIAAKSLEGELQQRLSRRFDGLYQGYAVLELKPLWGALRESKCYEESLREAEGRIAAQAGQARQVCAALAASNGEMIDALTREETQLAGLWREWGELRLRANALEHLHQLARESEDRHAASVKRQHGLLQAHAQHLAASLAQAVSRHAALEREVALLLETLEGIEKIAGSLRELTVQTLLLEILLSYQGNVLSKRRIQNRIEQRGSDVYGLLTAIGLSLKTVSYPFKDSKKQRLMDYLVDDAQHDVNPDIVLERALDVLGRLPLVQERLLARLLVIADQT